MSDKRRKVRVKIAEVIDAFEMGSYESQHYLDLETGQIVWISEDMSFELNQVLDELDQDGELTSSEIAETIAKSSMPDWQKSVILEAAQVKIDSGSRYLPVPVVASYEAYEDMESFIDTVEDEQQHHLLQVAIRGRGAFRRFKDVLYDFPEEREHWFGFKRDRMRQRALDWVTAEGIEVTD